MTIQTHPIVVKVCLAGVWHVAFTTRHRNGAAIVLREALAALGMFMRCHVGVSGPTRFLLVMDSSSLIGAFAKDRSCSDRNGSTFSVGLLPSYRHACSPGDFLRGSILVSALVNFELADILQLITVILTSRHPRTVLRSFVRTWG